MLVKRDNFSVNYVVLIANIICNWIRYYLVAEPALLLEQKSYAFTAQ